MITREQIESEAAWVRSLMRHPLPALADYPIDTRAHAHQSRAELYRRWHANQIPAQAFVLLHQRITAALRRYEALDFWAIRYAKDQQMPEHYRFSFAGTAADDQTWLVEGEIECTPGEIFNKSMEQAFEELTHGRAIYGRPGLACSGPYTIDEAHIVKVKQGETQAELEHRSVP